MRLVVFTDLDGTLLDHDDYSCTDAEPALERLSELEVPLVMVTSKTRAEVEALRDRMGLDEPFITENGGGIFFPHRCGPIQLDQIVQIGGYSAIILGRPYSQVRSFVESRKEEYLIEGFGDMTLDRIVELTGLRRDEAELAVRREFTEPFRLERDSDLERLSEDASREGLAVTTGGRLYHLTGAGQDKGRAVDLVSRYYRDRSEEGVVTVGLGDSPNDLPMLRMVDRPIVIPRVLGGRLELPDTEAQTAAHPGSRGWNEAVMAELARVYSAGG